MDLDLIRRLHRKVNIVLVIGKADCLNKTEVRKLKERILQDLEDNHIQLYQFPECDSDEDDDFKQQDRELKASIPFAVVGSNTILEVAGKKVRGRQYPWGVVNVEDAEHSDFIKLRTFLISTHMQDLKDTTQVSCGLLNQMSPKVTKFLLLASRMCTTRTSGLSASHRYHNMRCVNVAS